MAPVDTLKRFAALVEKDGGTTAAAARIGCSTTGVVYIIEGKRNPGMKLARAIQAVYGIPMEDWIEPPKMHMVKGVV